MAAFWDAMISVYWSSKPRELHLMTEDCKSVVFARFHPEEKVLSCAAHPGFCSCLSWCHVLP